MRIGEFIEVVRSYGVSPTLTSTDSLGSYYEELLDLARPGSGYQRDYTARHIRRLVSWLTIGAVVADNERGQRGSSSPQRYQAVRLMAAAPEGWIVMADGRASWSLVYPTGTLRSRCAVAIPVPAWRH